MNRVRVAGSVLTVVAIAGYVVGISVAYPGRALSVALLMAGLTMVAIGGGES